MISFVVFVPNVDILGLARTHSTRSIIAFFCCAVMSVFRSFLLEQEVRIMSKLIVLQCVRLEDKNASFTSLNVHQTEILENVLKKYKIFTIILPNNDDRLRFSIYKSASII